MNTMELISEFTSFEAVSGYEEDFTSHLYNIMKTYTNDVKIDKYNNVISAFKCGKKNAAKVMLEAHLDQIGLMVSEITKEGKVKFVNLGGVDQRILPSSECFILGRERIFGVIEATPSDKDKKAKIEDMSVITGFSSEYLLKNVSVGDPIVFKTNTVQLCGNQLAGIAMDNRAGIASLIITLEKLKNIITDFDLYVLFASQEELGMHGAYFGAETIKPDIAIAVDVTHGLTPSVKKEDGAFETGSGAVVCRGPNFDYDLTNKMIETAEKNNIPYSVEIASGNSGTDAWAIQTAGDGVKTMLVSIPLKYMHTTVETLDISDVEAAANLIFEFLTGGDFCA